MGILKLGLFLLYLFFTIISATKCCFSFTTCGRQIIPLSCSYPGLNLTCKSPENQTIITLADSREFLVRKINYLTQTLLVYDPSRCLPKRLLGFNFSSSPFMPYLSAATYTLFSCPRELGNRGFPTITCLSNTSRLVVAILNCESPVDAQMVSKRCQKMDTLMLPDNSTALLLGDAHLHLKWDFPLCKECQANPGMCGLHHDHPKPAKGGKKKAETGMEVLKIIAMSIAIPAMICSVGVGFFLWVLDNNIPPPQQPAAGAVVIEEGLDEATIESYAKVVLGESKRVPGPNDETCPICLSEFNPKETLRCIPQCQHFFHTDCIDEWLRIKPTCPLCRKLPYPLQI